MSINTDYDIMIVGGGPAGISTWLHLHKYAPELAEKTMLIDKAQFPRDKICGGGVGAWSPMIFKNLGITFDIPHLMISDIEFRYDDNSFLLHQPDSFMMVQRKEFDHALVKTAKKRGIVLYENEMFVDVKKKKDHILVQTNKGQYAVKILVGADGALSAVRKKMNLRNTPHLASTLEYFAPVNPLVDHEFDQKKIVLDMTCQKHLVQGYIWHLPCIRDNTSFMCHGIGHLRVYPEKPKPDMVSIFKQELRNRGISTPVNTWSSHPVRWYSPNDVISQPNVILVGDAVGIEPAFGGGIHFALSYGEVASQAVVEAFEQNDFKFTDYAKKIQSHFIGKFIAKCTHLAQGMFSNKLDPIDVAKEVFTLPACR